MIRCQTKNTLGWRYLNNGQTSMHVRGFASLSRSQIIQSSYTICTHEKRVEVGMVV